MLLKVLILEADINYLFICQIKSIICGICGPFLLYVVLTPFFFLVSKTKKNEKIWKIITTLSP